ncbi:MAG: hypothetical protein ABSA75_04825 [Candidatus Bathyarchaeia archaeon]|jgi:hypothetical protein
MLFNDSLRKVPNKISEAIVNLRAPLAIPAGNNIHRKVIFAAICLVTVIILGVIMGAFSSNKTIAYASSVQGFGAGIYWDKACTNRTLSLDWGLTEAGSNYTLILYVKNEGNSAAFLSLGTSNWTPSDTSRYMSLNWNYSGQVLREDQVIPLELTLTVYPTISGITSFSFKTIITTSER